MKEREESEPWMIISDHTGVIIKGESPKMYEASHLDDFAFVVADAMREYLQLKKSRIQLVVN